MKTLYCHRLTLIALLLLTCAVPAIAREGADPAINKPYLDPDFAQWVKRFETPGRMWKCQR